MHWILAEREGGQELRWASRKQDWDHSGTKENNPRPAAERQVVTRTVSGRKVRLLASWASGKAHLRLMRESWMQLGCWRLQVLSKGDLCMSRWETVCFGGWVLRANGTPSYPMPLFLLRFIAGNLLMLQIFFHGSSMQLITWNPWPEAAPTVSFSVTILICQDLEAELIGTSKRIQ